MSLINSIRCLCICPSCLHPDNIYLSDLSVFSYANTNPSPNTTVCYYVSHPVVREWSFNTFTITAGRERLIFQSQQAVRPLLQSQQAVRPILQSQQAERGWYTNHSRQWGHSSNHSRQWGQSSNHSRQREADTPITAGSEANPPITAGRVRLIHQSQKYD